MKITMIRNPGTPLLKKAGALDQKDKLVEKATVDVSHDAADVLVAGGAAIHGVSAAAPVQGIPAEVESPVHNDNAADAIALIATMRSKEKLQSIADHDKRNTVVDAAKKRLSEV